jgi:2-keto-4-pentenoate hydratase
VGDVHPDAVAALARQLERRRAALRDGHRHVGWKLGVGRRERIAGHLAVGHLTSATVLPPGGRYRGSAADGDLHADAEVFVELGRDVAPGADAAALAAATAYGAALEIVDLAPLPDEPAGVVAANVFHRAVAFGPPASALLSALTGALVVNGVRRASAPVADDLGRRIAAAASLLGAAGERLRAGDRVITGSIVQVAIARGDRVVADVGALGTVALEIVPPAPAERA